LYNCTFVSFIGITSSSILPPFSHFERSFHAQPRSSYNRKLTNNSDNLQIVSERFVEVTQALVLVPHNPKFCSSSVPEFLQKFACRGYPQTP
jgi:hypothetical protein